MNQAKKCTSLIVRGGIVGGVIGPLIATKGASMFPEHLFLRTFFISGVVFILAWVSQLFISLPRTTVVNTKSNDVFSGSEIKTVLSSSQFITGTLSCALVFSIMTLMMNAAPLAMCHAHYDIRASAFVLQWHFFAMYAPALFLPLLISRLKTAYIVQLDAIFFVVGAIFSFCYEEFRGYIFALSAIGIGWGFMFTGGTFLINQMANPEIKHKIQGINSSATYMLNLIASLSVGFFMNIAHGWLIINSMVVFVMLIFLFYMLLHTRYHARC